MKRQSKIKLFSPFFLLHKPMKYKVNEIEIQYLLQFC